MFINQHYSANFFNHCSSVCSYKHGVLITWYSGACECHEYQSVQLIFITPEFSSNLYQFPAGSGNPVLWTVGDDSYILWSQFEHNPNIEYLVDKWKYCSLWYRHIEYNNGWVLGDPIQISEAMHHLLARCAPITHQGHTLFPLYNELLANCVIYDIDNKCVHSTFGDMVIQPSIWSIDNDLYALTRNFNLDPNKPHATYSKLYNLPNGREWTGPIDTQIPNTNNSLCVIPWRDKFLIVWNDTLKRYRSHLKIGLLSEDKMSVSSSMFLDASYGAYPSACLAGDILHVTYTNKHRSITHRAITLESLWQQLCPNTNSNIG